MVCLNQYTVELSWIDLEKSQFLNSLYLRCWYPVSRLLPTAYHISEYDDETFNWLKQRSYTYAYKFIDRAKHQNSSGIIFIFENKKDETEFKTKIMIEKLAS